jgi:hypothetical protein
MIDGFFGVCPAGSGHWAWDIYQTMCTILGILSVRLCMLLLVAYQSDELTNGFRPKILILYHSKTRAT